MPLTTAQLATLKTDIANNSDLNVHPNTSDGNFEVARLYNLPAAVDHYVWRTRVSKKEIVSVQSTDSAWASISTSRSRAWANRTPGRRCSIT